MSSREEMSRKYRSLLVAVRAPRRDKYALGLAVRVLDLLAENSLLKAQADLAGGLADAIRHRVPAEIAEQLAPSKENKE